MHNKHSNNPLNLPLTESLAFKDMEGLLKPTIHVDEFSSKMGDDDDIIVISFFVRDEQAAKDLMSWFEKGYDFVLDASLFGLCRNPSTQYRRRPCGAVVERSEYPD